MPCRSRAWLERRAWRTQLGCFDPALNQIVLNRRLDHGAIPEYVVAYVLYHEMLHQKHPMSLRAAAGNRIRGIPAGRKASRTTIAR